MHIKRGLFYLYMHKLFWTARGGGVKDWKTFSRARTMLCRLEMFENVQVLFIGILSLFLLRCYFGFMLIANLKKVGWKPVKNRIRFIQLLANVGSENGDQPKKPPDISPTEYSWRDQAHLLQRPVVHEWQIVSRSKWACQQFCQIRSASIQFFYIDKS